MRLITLVVFLATAVTMAARPAERVAYAKPMNSIIYWPTTALGVELTGEELNTIHGGLVDVLNFQLKKAAWKCVEHDPLLAPLAPDVAIEVVIGEDIRGEPGDLAVWVRVTVRGRREDRLRIVPAARLDPNDRGPTLRGEAQAALIELLNKFAPCKAKVKLNGRFRQEVGSFLFERTVNGEGELALNEHGTFEMTMTIPDDWGLIAPGTGLTEQGGVVARTCQVTSQARLLQLTWSGTYRPEDGALVFTEMREEASATHVVLHCCGIGGCFDYSADIPGWAGNAPLDVRLALADGATVSFSIPPPPGAPGRIEQEMTLTLEYGGESAEDVAGTPIVGLTP